MIYKPGKPINKMTSYRSISLTPILSKLLEKVLLTRLKKYLSEDHIIPDHQLGFPRDHSTLEQVHREFFIAFYSEWFSFEGYTFILCGDSQNVFNKKRKKILQVSSNMLCQNKYKKPKF